MQLRKSAPAVKAFQRIVKALEQSLGRPLSLELQGAVAADLEKHILAYDTCGCSALCDEATVPSKWNKGYEDFLLSQVPEAHDRVWGGWGPVRGALIPGTAIFSARLA